MTQPHVRNETLEQEYLDACQEGNLQKVREILHGEYFLNYPNKQFFLNEGSVHAACNSASFEVLRYLTCSPELSLHADVNCGAGHALRIASTRDIAMVKFLLASPQLKTHTDYRGSEKDPHSDCFRAACEEGTAEIVRFYCNEPSIQKPDFYKKYGSNETILEVASHGGNLEVVKYFLEEEQLQHDQRFYSASPKLLTGYRYNYLSRNRPLENLVEYYCFSPALKKHIDFDALKENLAYIAANNDDIGLLHYIAQRSTTALKLDYQDIGNFDKTPLLAALENKDDTILQYILCELRHEITEHEKSTIRRYSTQYEYIIEKQQLFLHLEDNLKEKSPAARKRKI